MLTLVAQPRGSGGTARTPGYSGPKPCATIAIFDYSCKKVKEDLCSAVSQKPPLNETLKAQCCIMVLCRPPYAGFCRRLPIKSCLLFRSLRQFPFSDTSLRRGQQLRRLDSPTHNFGRIRRIGL
jgi:hypothetical protein